MKRVGAYTNVSVLPQADTSIEVRVSGDDYPLVSIGIGDGGHGVSIIARDEETLNALASAVGEARAKLAGAVVRAKREQAAQPELLASL